MANLSNINGKFVVEQTTGYVGVGTTDPNYPIEVLNASAEIALNASGASIYRLKSDSTDSFRINKNGVGDRLVIAGNGYATFANRVNAGESFGALKDGADTVADGPFFRLTNAATTRQYLFQLDASNNIDYWYYNGSTWTQTISLLNNGGAIFTGNVGIGTVSPDGKLEVAGGTTLGLRLSNVGDSSAYDQVRMTYGGYNSGSPTVTFMPLTTPGGGNVFTTFLFQNTNGINASSNNNANVAIDGTLQVGRSKGTGETTLIMNNYDTSLAGTNQIQNSIRMSGRYWSGSASQLVQTRINSVHQQSDGNGGSALTFWTQTGGDAPNEKLRIDKDGKVGIGTNSPWSKFAVNGTTALTTPITKYNSSNSSWVTILTFTTGVAYSVLLATSENNFSQMWRVSGSVNQSTCYVTMLGDSNHPHSKDAEFRITSGGALQYKNINYTTGRYLYAFDVVQSNGTFTS